MAEDVTTLSRLLDTSKINYSKRRQPSQMPVSTRLSEQSLHFKTANNAELFFHADMSRAMLIRSFSFGYGEDLGWIRGLDNLHFLFWSTGGLGRCADEIYTIAYVKSYDNGKNSPLLSFIVWLTEYASPDHPSGSSYRHDLHRSAYPLEELSLDTLDKMSDEQLMVFRRATMRKRLIEWPPKYVSYKADDQDRLKIYMDKIFSVSGTYEFWETPNCYETV